jgi:hypothetical protein
MLRLVLFAVALSVPPLSHGTEPLIDNERVVVWDTMNALPPSKHDFVSVSLSQLGTAVYGNQGEVPSQGGARTIVIELKENSPAPIPNNSGYPLAFPRPHAAKLFENDRVIAWSVQWPPGEPTPMHFHDKDAVAVFEATGSLQSATPDGKKTAAATRFGEVLFAGRDRTHAELRLGGEVRAIIIELK